MCVWCELCSKWSAFVIKEGGRKEQKGKREGEKPRTLGKSQSQREERGKRRKGSVCQSQREWPTLATKEQGQMVDSYIVVLKEGRMYVRLILNP